MQLQPCMHAGQAWGLGKRRFAPALRGTSTLRARTTTLVLLSPRGRWSMRRCCPLEAPTAAASCRARSATSAELSPWEPDSTAQACHGRCGGTVSYACAALQPCAASSCSLLIELCRYREAASCCPHVVHPLPRPIQQKVHAFVNTSSIVRHGHSVVQCQPAAEWAEETRGTQCELS